MTPSVPTTTTRGAIQRRLLNWYDKNKRDLPWRRREHDPYAQWVAEIMLQQTRVDTALRFYEPFLKRFPNVTALARAQEASVLKAWEGLGYYRRARYLHQAAKQVVTTDGAKIPSTAARLCDLPGIGDYTAAAIASIAFGEVVAAIDGNVARVIARLFAIEQDVRSQAGQTRVSVLARELVSPTRPGDFNQTWMDLGSMVCTPQTPSCPVCPLKRYCQGLAQGIADELPVLAKAKTPIPVRLVVGVFAQNEKLLVARDAQRGWWRGLWGFPMIERKQRTPLQRTLRELATSCDVELTSKPARTKKVRHQLTHRTLTFEVLVSECRPAQRGQTASIDPNVEHRWVTRAGFKKLAVSTAHRKVFSAAEQIMQER